MSSSCKSVSRASAITFENARKTREREGGGVGGQC